MKRIQKVISIMLLSLLCLSLFPLNSYAATTETETSSAEYDLTIGGTQSFQLVDKDNNLLIVTITEEEDILRLENKTYSVSFKSPLAWEAGYKVVVNNNSITSVHSAWNKSITGTIISGNLLKESSKQATYYMTRQFLGVVTTPAVRTTISGTTMEVFSL